MAKIIKIGETQDQVRLNHATKDPIYFFKNILFGELIPMSKEDQKKVGTFIDIFLRLRKKE